MKSPDRLIRMITPQLAKELLALESNDLLIRILSDKEIHAAVSRKVTVKLDDGRDRYLRLVRKFLEVVLNEAALFIDLSVAEAEAINQARAQDPSYADSIQEMKAGDQVKRKKLLRAQNIIADRKADGVA